MVHKLLSNLVGTDCLVRLTPSQGLFLVSLYMYHRTTRTMKISDSTTLLNGFKRILKLKRLMYLLCDFIEM